MNENVKREWIAALRSGEYRQGQDTLHNTRYDTYCCLGVLCDLAVKAGVTEVVGGPVGGITYYGGEAGCLPEPVMEWAGLCSVDPIAGERNWPLSHWNDTGTPFEEIAELIEQYL